MRCHQHPSSGSCAVLFGKVNSCFWQLLCKHTRKQASDMYETRYLPPVLQNFPSSKSDSVNSLVEFIAKYSVSTSPNVSVL